MRICLINPNSTESMTAEMVEAARAVAAPGMTIDGVTAERAPATIEGYRDDALASAAVVEIVAERRSEHDAFVIRASTALVSSPRCLSWASPRRASCSR
jgi:allantoin racemase